MILTSDEIYLRLHRLDFQQTGNIIDSINVYEVKSRQVTLYIEKTTNGSNRYTVKFNDFNTGEYAETYITFVAYPSKEVDYAPIDGNNGYRLVWNNSGMRKALREIVKAIGQLYRLPICREHI